MIKLALFQLFSSRRRIHICALLVVFAFCASVVRFRPYWHFEGVYILKGGDGWLEVKDDLVLGDEARLLLALPAEPIIRLLEGGESHASMGTHLEFEWFRFDGRGHVEGRFADGTIFLTCLSRYLDSDGKETKGVFVGGELPFELRQGGTGTLNDTGVSYYDGTLWHHLWCNVNESIAPSGSPGTIIAPSSWKFLGSRVAKKTPGEVVITSNHEVVLDGVPFRVDRVAWFRAGSRYFTLAIRLTNTGRFSGGYYYVYGDEPWVGNYGSSAGNVGWVRDRLVPYEGEINSREYRWAGYFDFGNEAAGEQHIYSGLANFIEWQGNVTPDLVYFSNQIGSFAPPERRVPLSHPNNRVLFLQWGPRFLAPGQSDTIVLSIGMADRDPATGFPVKPDTPLDPALLEPFFGTGS